MKKYNAHIKGQTAKLALTIFVLFGAGQSYAACTQSDMTGTWYFNGFSGDTFSGILFETNFCKIRVNSSGKIRNTGSQCNFRDSDGKGPALNVKGGNLTVKSSCAITGRVKICEGEDCVDLVIDDAKMDSGKTVVTLVGRASDDVDVVAFLTGVKK